VQIPHADPGRACPFNGKDVSKVCHRCPLYVQIRGKNPQSNEEVDRWDCSLALLPMLLIENAQQSRQTGAAVESFRNEASRTNAAQAALMMQAVTGSLASAPRANAAFGPTASTKMIEGQ
jgi:hypothetical protein